MWCLETIIQLNETAAELARQGKPTSGAYALCGINVPNNRKLVEEFEATKDKGKKKMKVVA